ncbi:hypothetical protein CBR_g23048 [Chara braunii]|uniref:Probable glucan 1,3-alpha-glucosidase n=1 Tax=Chara braunii TaxID=69332 RepID=A0A388L3K5_CHABU|nr:hypothetical protein CBR_g23048 [Chara braunii]|eukprot:GBG76832.1 hypothetical protein CBR_g23048 [Chara braunii]
MFRALCLWVLFVVANGFKSEEFRNCDKASFCRRNRFRPEGNSTIVLRSGVVNGGVYVGTVEDTVDNGVALELWVIAYEGGIFRVRLKERNPLRVRFEPPDALVSDLDLQRVSIEAVPSQANPDVTYLHTNDGSGAVLIVQHTPVQIDLAVNNAYLMSVNNRGLLNFEHYREKRDGDEEGMWQETFRSFTDSKPYGPASVAFDLTFLGSEHVYGLPEHATGSSLKETRHSVAEGGGAISEPYRLFNLDVFEYLSESPFGLYGSIPLMISHSAERTVAAFWLNAAEMFVDVTKVRGDFSSQTIAQRPRVVTHWISETGILDLFLFVGPRPKDVVRQYTGVTGRTPLPPMFAIAYHQSRWNYRDEEDVYEVDNMFDTHAIPYDVLWLDIEHTDGKRYFTWDKSLFPSPIVMQNRMASKGRHMVTIVDPHIKRDPGFVLHEEATAKGYYVKDSSGRDYDGWCWPGSSSYVDTLHPEFRSWWADKFSLANYVGSTPILHIWNDMNEPSVFNGPEISLPRDALHHGGFEHREVHNAYGMYFHMASYEGLLRRGGYKERAFVLSRAFFAGSQRVGAVWTGDNAAQWDHLAKSIPMVLTLGLSGLAFSGADVGGFFGNPDAELLLRWYQLGAFYPFFRAHAHLDTKRREPWLFGEPWTSDIRDAVRRRYMLLPYYYTLFKETSKTGVPVMRPLWLEYPSDAAVFALDSQFLVGKDLLVRPVLEAGAKQQSVYFPGNDVWYDVLTCEGYLGGRVADIVVSLSSVPVFQRGGSIIPRKDRARRSSTQMEKDPYTLVVALNLVGEAEGTLYVDDGKSFDFDYGAYIRRRFTFANNRLESVNDSPIGRSAMEYATDCLVERVVILGLAKDQYRAVLEMSAQHGRVRRDVDAVYGPPMLLKGAQNRALVLRLPNVPVSSDWSITIGKSSVV